VLLSVPSRRRRRRSRHALLLGALTLTATAALPAAAPAAAAQRAYELVSPADKASSDVLNGDVATADGDAVTYNTYGTLAGGQTAVYSTFYRSRRTASGWVAEQLSPTQTAQGTSLATTAGAVDFTADLRTMWVTPVISNQPLSTDDHNNSLDVYASTVGGGLAWQSPGLDPSEPGDSLYAGRSDDGRHVVFESYKSIVPGVPGSPVGQVYEIAGGVTRLVSLIGGAPAAADAHVGGGRASAYLQIIPDRRAVSADGSVIFFNAGGELYARVGGDHTVLVSGSAVTGHEGDPSGGANFEGAADDGHLVTFSSATPLVDGATDGGLYSYNLLDGSLHQLAETPTYQLAVIKTAPDGARVYFETEQQLGGAGGSTGANLWVASTDGSGAPRFIGAADPGDVALWGHGENYNRGAVSADGTRLAFASAADLTHYDSGGTTEVYVYDDATQTTSCPSCPSGGAAATGSASLSNPNNSIPTTPRTFTRDGHVFFETPQSLVRADGDDRTDVYEAAPDGDVTLLTPGTAQDVHLVDNASDGSTVFVMTREALVPTDVDGGNTDVYAVRVGGGFPEPPAPCAGSACRGPESGVAPALPGTGTATAFDLTPGTAPATATTFKVSSISAAARRSFARTGALALRVRVGDTAVLTATGRGNVGRKVRTIASGRTHRLGAGTVTLTVRLTAAARRALARSGRLTVRLAVACSDSRKVARATLVLTKTTNKKKAGR
jgi:hypothetical protein